MIKNIILSCCMVCVFAFWCGADTIDLKSGKRFDGAIVREGDDSVEFDIGFGTMVFRKDQIAKITRSGPDELKDIKRKWNSRKKQLKQQEDVLAKERDDRFDAYEAWSKEGEAKRKQEISESKEIKIFKDADSKSVLTEVMLNGKTKAMLVLDTGASIIVLSRRMGDALGIDLSDLTKDMMELQLAGGKRVKAKATLLKSVAIKDVEENNILAAILIDEVVDPSFKDGLLGRTFLSRFNISLDMKNMKMTLEKIKH